MNVYVVPGPQALRLTRLSRQDLENHKGPQVHCSFRKMGRNNKDTSSKRASKAAPGGGTESNNQNKASGSQKRKRQPTPKVVESEDIEDVDIDEKDGLGCDDVEDLINSSGVIESEPDDDTWTFSVSAGMPSRKKLKKIGGNKLTLEKLPQETSWDDGEIITLSSD